MTDLKRGNDLDLLELAVEVSALSRREMSDVASCAPPLLPPFCGRLLRSDLEKGSLPNPLRVCGAASSPCRGAFSAASSAGDATWPSPGRCWRSEPLPFSRPSSSLRRDGALDLDEFACELSWEKVEPRESSLYFFLKTENALRTGESLLPSPPYSDDACEQSEDACELTPDKRESSLNFFVYFFVPCFLFFFLLLFPSKASLRIRWSSSTQHSGQATPGEPQCRKHRRIL